MLQNKINQEKLKFKLNDYYSRRIPSEILDDFDYCLIKCDKCSLIFQKYILTPTLLNALYETWISAKKSLMKKKNSDVNLFSTYAREIENICHFIPRKPNQIKVLDFGMGWGYWARMAAAYGFNVCGYEFSDSRTTTASNAGIRVIQDLSQLADSSIDYVYSNQVFEHIPSPGKTLAVLKSKLSPRGVIHLQVPNGILMSYQLALNGKQLLKSPIHPLEHVNCFNRRSLRIMAGLSSLRLLQPPFTLYRGLKSLYVSPYRFLADAVISTQVYLANNLT